MDVKRFFSIVILFAFFFFVACNSQPIHHPEVENYVSILDLESETEVKVVTSFERVEENVNTDYSVIDYTFTQIINNSLMPFNFRVLGEIVDESRVRIDTVIISDSNGMFIQKIDGIRAWPRNATEINRFGLEFGGYISDGYTSMSIRRFPGESLHNRTHYYWLWDDETRQFVYDWKLSEAVTEENFIDYMVMQSIHEEMLPFTFRIMGRWIEGWSFEAGGVVDNIQANIHIIQVMNSAGEIIQEFDRLNAFPHHLVGSFGLHFADYNFDGFLDMALYMAEGGSMRNSPHIYWLWDNNEQQFIKNETLTQISNFSTISISTQESRLESFTRIGSSHFITGYYKYIDNDYVLVGYREMEAVPSPDEEHKYVLRITIGELVDGEMTIIEYYENLE